MSKIIEISVGIDYHQNFCRVCGMDSSGKVLFDGNCESTAAYVDKFVRWHFGEKIQVHLEAGIEACGGAAKFAEDLRQLGWQVDLAHAATVARLGKHLDKTDKQDAHVLADLLRVGYLPHVYLAPERQRQLRSLVRYRMELAKRQKQTRMRIRGLMRESHLKLSTDKTAWTKGWLGELRSRIDELGSERTWICEQYLTELAELKKQLLEGKKRLERAVAEAPGSEQLLAQKGVGLITAAILLAEIGDFHRFRSGKQLCRYCGMAPVNMSSGDRDYQRGIGKECNGDLRRMLIEASHRLSRYVPRWKAMKDRLIRNGKKRAVATVAVANRWLRRLHFEMTHPNSEALAA